MAKILKLYIAFTHKNVGDLEWITRRDLPKIRYRWKFSLDLKRFLLAVGYSPIYCHLESIKKKNTESICNKEKTKLCNRPFKATRFKTIFAVGTLFEMNLVIQLMYVLGRYFHDM